jgi:hypothetical protein
MVEVNGNDNKSCIFDCDSKMGQIGSKVNGRHSRYFNNEPMLFTDNYVYDNKNNVYKVANGAKFAICGDFIFFTMEDSASVVIFLKDSPNKNIVITLSDNLIDTYMDNFTIYLTDKDNKIYKSTVEEGNDANFYFIFFNYDEFSKKEENGESIKEIDIRTIQPNILTYLNMLKGDAGTNNSQVSDQYDQYYRDLFGGIDIEGVGFIFYITGDDNKRVWTLFGDDKRQDDVFTEMVEVFGIG